MKFLRMRLATECKVYRFEFLEIFPQGKWRVLVRPHNYRYSCSGIYRGAAFQAGAWGGQQFPDALTDRAVGAAARDGGMAAV